jgi:hypothetical protein
MWENEKMQTHDVSRGLEPAIIRLVLGNPDMRSSPIMRELRTIGWGDRLTELGDEARSHVRLVRRIVRLTLAEQARQD